MEVSSNIFMFSRQEEKDAFISHFGHTASFMVRYDCLRPRRYQRSLMAFLELMHPFRSSAPARTGAQNRPFNTAGLTTPCPAPNSDQEQNNRPHFPHFLKHSRPSLPLVPSQSYCGTSPSITHQPYTSPHTYKRNVGQ